MVGTDDEDGTGVSVSTTDFFAEEGVGILLCGAETIGTVAPRVIDGDPFSSVLCKFFLRPLFGVVVCCFLVTKVKAAFGENCGIGVPCEDPATNFLLDEEGKVPVRGVETTVRGSVLEV